MLGSWQRPNLNLDTYPQSRHIKCSELASIERLRNRVPAWTLPIGLTRIPTPVAEDITVGDVDGDGNSDGGESEDVYAKIGAGAAGAALNICHGDAI